MSVDLCPECGRVREIIPEAGMCEECARLEGFRRFYDPSSDRSVWARSFEEAFEKLQSYDLVEE